MKLIYLAHPVRGDIPVNVARAKAWVKWLTEELEAPSAVIAPWIVDLEIWDDSDEEHRRAGLERCAAVIRRCDELWLLGGRVSEGMAWERAVAMRAGLTVVDATCMGLVPPGVKDPGPTFGGISMVADPDWPENRPPALVNIPSTAEAFRARSSVEERLRCSCPVAGYSSLCRVHGSHGATVAHFRGVSLPAAKVAGMSAEPAFAEHFKGISHPLDVPCRLCGEVIPIDHERMGLDICMGCEGRSRG